MENINMLLTAVLALTAITNIVTEVVKKVTWDKIPTNLLAVIIAEVLTLAGGTAYAQITGLEIMWFHGFGAVVIGMFVAYAAMFGFDKFKQALEQIKTSSETK